MTNRPLHLGVLAVLGLTSALPARAQEKVGPDTYALPLHQLDVHPKTVRAARRTLRRIDEAALAVCGASAASLPALRRATRRTACWQDSMDQAVNAIADPLLTRVHRQGK
ncbi:MAG: UrcA family protein [Beijerinckiaceae bacterium]|jgi:UrcA family protein|nr:UrcA family protein [Beijerinckiaceae bacterium]